MLRPLVVASAFVLGSGVAAASDRQHGLYIDLEAPTSKGVAIYIGPADATKVERVRTEGLTVLLDGKPISDARLTLNGVPAVRDDRTGAYYLTQNSNHRAPFKQVFPGVLLKVAAEAAGQTTTVTVGCPTRVFATPPGTNGAVKPGQELEVSFGASISEADVLQHATVRVEKATPPAYVRPEGLVLLRTSKMMSWRAKAKVPRGEAAGYLLSIELPDTINESAEGRMRCTTVQRMWLPAAK